MMENRRKLSEQELELLSAYIDGQLNDRQARRLEARLHEDLQLKAELDSLRMTVNALRDVSAPRPKRHFMLTPEMVGQREPARFVPVLRFATALAGLAFVALVGLEGLQSLSGAQLAARAPEAMREAEVAQDAIRSAEEPMAAAPAAEEAPEFEALEVPAEEAAEQEPEAMMMEEPEAEELAPTGEDQVMKVTGTPEATEVAGIAAGEEVEGRAMDGGDEDGIDQELGQIEAPEEAPAEGANATFAEESEPATIGRISPLRWLQAIAGALFIILSVLTITFRRWSF
jgi:hypothetical protein